MRIGTQYYRPPNPEPELWDSDFRRMRAMGLSSVRYWILWSTVNPERGVWKWDDLDRLFDLAHAHGIGVVAQLIPENQPRWFLRENSELARINAQGVTSPLLGNSIAAFGGFPGLSWEHQTVLDETATFYRAVAERYGSHPALYAWDLWNELQAIDISYDEATTAAWRAWIQSEYPDFAVFRETVKVDFVDAADVPLLRFDSTVDGCGTAPLQVIFQRWLADRIVGEMNRRAELVRQIDGDHLIVSHRGADPYVSTFLDEVDLVENLDAWGASNFNSPATLPNTYLDLALRLTSLRGATPGKQFWLAETVSGGMYHLYGHYLPTPAELKSSLLLAYAHGASDALYWQFRHERFGHEVTGWGLVNYDGSPNGRTDMTKQMAERISMADSSARRAAGAVAILANPDVQRLERTMGWVPQGATMAEELTGWFAACVEGGLAVEILSPAGITSNGIPEGLEVLVLPVHSIANEIVEKAILDWVAGGGTVVSTAHLGTLDEAMIAGRSVPTGPIGTALGARVTSRQYPQDVSVRIGDGADASSIAGFWVLETLSLDGAVPLGTIDDAPALVSRDHGRGRIIHFATLPGMAYLRGGTGLADWIATLISPRPGAGVALPAGTFAERLVGDAGEMLCIFNPTGSEVSVTIRPSDSNSEVRDVWRDQRIECDADGAVSLTIGALDSAWLSIST